jgi:signal transduction histidine kinase
VIAEALSNATKHAQATRIAVWISQEGHRAFVSVTDDGIGGADIGRGTGLRGLGDRVETLGGRLHVTSRAGQGATVRAELPLG